MFKHFLIFVSLYVILALVVGCSSQVSVKLSDSPANRSVKALSISDEALLPKGDKKPSVSLGKTLFEKYCKSCDVAALVNEKMIRSKTPMELFHYVSGTGEHAKDGLKDFSELGEMDRWHITFYLRSFYSKKPERADFDTLFGANCATCHGKRGHGDGPLGHKLYPLPANFNQVARMYNRSDELLYKRISEGIYPTAMPAWQDIPGMTDPAERWRFVDYVRSFSYAK
jgi:cytochrome c5